MKKKKSQCDDRSDIVIAAAEPNLEASAVTPQKDILSPPPVTRKVSFQTRRPHIRSLVCEEEEGMNSLCKSKSVAAAAAVDATGGNGGHDHDGTDSHDCNHDNDKNKNDRDHDDYEDELGSMVSQYGSDIGQQVISAMSLKLADLDVMLEEEDGEEEEGTEEKEGKRKEGEEERDMIISKNVVRNQEDCADSCENDNNGQVTAILIDNGDDDHDQDGEGSGGSVDSVDLDSSSSSSSSSSSLSTGNVNHNVPSQDHHIGAFANANANVNTTTMSPPSSPLTKLNVSFEHLVSNHHHPESPKTPIAAVSAALRRFGNNVSHMTRCNKLSPNVGNFGSGSMAGIENQGHELLSHHQQDVQKDSSQSRKENMWLSPRFDPSSLHPEQHLNHLEDSSLSLHREQQRLKLGPTLTDHCPSIQQPTLSTCQSYNNHNHIHNIHNNNHNHIYPQDTTTESVDYSFVSSSRNRSVAMMGITSCLSFDPESGKRPYGNMRWSDSPPSSPVPSSWKQHPRTKSWASTTDDVDIRHSSPRQVNSTTMPILVLQSPQRVGDIEREDALDLLELLVERSIAFHENASVENTTTRSSTSGKAASTLDHNVVGNEKSEIEIPDSESFQKCIDALCKISCDYEKNYEQLHQAKQDFDSTSHDDRMIVLRRLVDSHTYAKEMKQAALSASTWLTAIGRMGGNRTHQATPISQYISEEKLQQMDAKELRSLVHAAHAQLLEKNEINQKLESELSSCRGEIGRLKTAMSKKEHSFLSPDKSILDEDVNEESSDDSDSHDEFPESSDINFDVDEMRNRIIHKNSESVAIGMIEAKKEILLLKAELIESNKLLESMKKGSSISKIDESKNSIQCDQSDKIKEDDVDSDCLTTGKIGNDCGTIGDAETNNDVKMQGSAEQSTSTLLDGLQDELESYISTIRKADKEEIYNLQVKLDRLQKAATASQKKNDDTQNSITNWHKLDPLPPPPDHDLRSPIVHDLLSQWTSDLDTHESLLSWVERIVQGQHIFDIAPLQLSGLNQQLRDGFLMHVLPFLLRRSDINVEVITRERRETSYDLSVAVTKSEVDPTDYFDHKHEVNLSSKSLHMMAFKASAMKTSPNVSDHVLTPERKRGYSDNTPHGSSAIFSRHSECNDHIGHHQSGIMAGALNAMGGFLSRRRTPTSNNDVSSRNAFSLPSTPVSSQPNNAFHKEGNIIHPDFNESSQPYHRVVSAPPGRIGMTFVQYRGHAMVSDVYKDSPLAGWVFPSDILIAIDEVPVSGMRVPEIVKLLTARKDRQRSLRVISSHAMTELLTHENYDYPNDD